MIGRNEKFGSVGKQQTNIILMLALGYENICFGPMLEQQQCIILCALCFIL